jgi:hypothetical protein
MVHDVENVEIAAKLSQIDRIIQVSAISAMDHASLPAFRRCSASIPNSARPYQSR